MNRILKRLAALILCYTALSAAHAAPPPAVSAVPGLDPRLAEFLPRVIKDPKALKSEEETYATNNISFEQLILVIYTNHAMIDEPDNQRAIAQLGEYIDTKHPRVAPDLLPELEKYYNADKAHQAMVRAMFLNTLREAVKKK